MKALFVGFFCSMILWSCGNKPKDPVATTAEIAIYNAQAGDDLFHSEIIRDIEIIPLETSDSSLIGTGPECLVGSTGDYYVIDKNGCQKILRYDASGKFLNTIGNRGKGPQEYLKISNIWMDSATGQLMVFSNPDTKQCIYDPQGQFISGRKIDSQFLQGMPSAEGNLWLYLGHMNGASDHRLLKLDSNDKITDGILSAKVQIMPMDETFPVFIQGEDDRILLRETFNNQICSLIGDSLVPVYAFDFGEYNIPKQYFEMDDIGKSVEYIMQHKFVSIDRFMETQKYALIQALLMNPGGDNLLTYGIQDKKTKQWTWFNFTAPQTNTALGVNTIQTLTNQGDLICLVEPQKLIALSQADRAIFSNPDMISALTDESNSVILKCRLK